MLTFFLDEKKSYEGLDFPL